MIKNLPAMRETWVPLLGWEDPLEKGMATLSSISCLDNPHGQRSLVGYSPWGCKESDTTTKHSTFFSRASKVPLVVKNPPVKAGDIRHRFHPCVGKIPQSRAWLYSTLDSSLFLKVSILSILMWFQSCLPVSFLLVCSSNQMT